MKPHSPSPSFLLHPPNDDYVNQYCSIKHLDCRGYFDLGGHIIIFFIIVYVMWRTIRNYLNLQSEKTVDNISEYQKSLRRKISVNVMQIIYLTIFLLAVMLSIGLFWPSIRHTDFVKDHKLNKLYKLFQIFYINQLNSLTLTVGFLYWKAIRGYYILVEEELPFLFHSFGKKLFFVFYCFNISAFIIAIFWITTDLILFNSLNITTLVTTFISIVVCIFCRFFYRSRILTRFQIAERSIKKQLICSILLLISSLIRISFYLAEQLGWDYGDQVRSFQAIQQCIDFMPYNALIILFIDLFVNLLPAMIYSYLFTSQFKVSNYKTTKRKSREHLLS